MLSSASAWPWFTSLSSPLNGKSPHTGTKTQIAWTRLPQGFKNSPTLLGEALVTDLLTFLEENPSCTLLQYVDDLLLASHDWEKRWERMKALLL
jgi:hypothetical protein